MFGFSEKADSRQPDESENSLYCNYYVASDKMIKINTAKANRVMFLLLTDDNDHALIPGFNIHSAENVTVQ